MDTATSEEIQKISTMKLSISFFTSKLKNFIRETNATDENLLLILSHLTDTIQAFVLSARVVKTNNTIESIVDKNCLSCENIFECFVCNVQTGKTYNSVFNHITTTKHIARVKQIEKQKKAALTANNLKGSVTVGLPSFPLSVTQPINGNFSQLSGQIDSSPVLHNGLDNLADKGFLLTPRPMPIPPAVGLNQGSTINNLGVENNTPANLFFGNENLRPTTPDDYKLFRMPLPRDVLGFQQNVISPSKNFLRDLNQTTEGPREGHDKTQSIVVKPRKPRRRTKRGKTRNLKEFGNLDERTISFLKGNFEDGVMELIQSARKLTSEDLYQEITMNLKECCSELKINAEVKCFGSRIIGIGSIQSDVDLNISAPDCLQTAEKFLPQLLEVLHQKPYWRLGFYIQSRVALVRIRHALTDIDCDITFNNEMAMANTKLIKYFYAIQPECQKLVVFLKIWAEKLKLQPQINTYTINLMAFFYLQIEGFLPKVMDLVDAPTLKYWPSKFTPKPLDELNMKVTKTFKELCLGFMDFYAHHADFDNYVLSTFTGSPISKSLFGTNEYRTINDCYDGLLKFMKENAGAAEHIKKNFKMAMCIQDPFSHDHNVSRCVGKANLKRFKKCCHESYDLLRSEDSENA